MRIDNRYGDIRIDRAATLHARTSAGDVTVGRSTRTASSSPPTDRSGSATPPEPCAWTAPAATSRWSARWASVAATTKYGQVSVHQAGGGSLDLATSYGKVEAGVREGTPAWLDLESRPGRSATC